MINFYNNVLLWLLPLSILPLVLHLLSFKKSKRLQFSYTFLVEKVVQSNLIEKKIVDIVVLILRCLIIFFLIIYFARPVLFYNPSNKNNINLIIAIDSSMSMRQRMFNESKFKFIVDAVEKSLKYFRAKRIKVHLIMFDEEIKVLNKKFEFVEEISFDKNNYFPSYKSTDVNMLLNYSINMFNMYGDEYQNKVLIFTDFAEHVFEDIKNKEFVENKYGIDFLFCYPEITNQNGYIKSAQVTLKNNLFSIEFFPLIPKDSIPTIARFFIENKMVDSANIILGKEKYSFNYIVEQKTNNIAGYISLTPDALNEDNNFYFTYADSMNKSILCIVDEPFYLMGINSLKYYFEKLNVLGYEFKVINYEKVQDENKILEENENIIFVNNKQLLGYDKNKFFDKKMLFFCDTSVSEENYDKFFDGLEFIEEQENVYNNYYLVLGDDEDFNNFAKSFNLKNVEVKKKYKVNINKNYGWRTLLKFNDGTPALLQKEKMYVFTFSADRELSNIIYKPFFVSIIKKLFGSQDLNNNGYKNYYFVSEKINIKNVKSIYYDKNNPILEEDKYFKITPESVTFYKPGFYYILDIDNNERCVAVNAILKESNLQLSEKDKVRNKMKSIKRSTISFLDISKSNYENEFIKWCFGKEYSDNVVLLIAIMFVLETILSRTRKRII